MPKKGDLITERYLIVEKVKEGGQGVVFRAQDRRLDCHVALKFIKAEFLNDRQFRKRLMAEARAAASIQHPAIARSLDCVDDERECFVAFEFVEGTTLREELNAGRRLSLDHLLKVALTVADALRKIHEKGLIHRDLKPENIMVSPDAGSSLTVKILDFGLAKHTEYASAPPGGATVQTHDGTVKTEAMAFAGTLGYMSPEQLPESPQMPVDGRADIFSLGVVLYELATGQNPFYVPGNGFEIVRRTHEVEPPPLQQSNRETDGELGRIVQKCLRKRREDRYPSAHELLADLEKLKRRYSLPEVINLPGIASPEIYIRLSRGWARSLLALTQVAYLVMYGVTLLYFGAAGQALQRLFQLPLLALHLGTAACIVVGTALHIYLLAAVAWDYERSGWLFKCIFPAILAFDLIWAASPLLLLARLQEGVLMCSPLLAFLPFAQRDLILAAYSPRGGRVSSVPGPPPSQP